MFEVVWIDKHRKPRTHMADKLYTIPVNGIGHILLMTHGTVMWGLPLTRIISIKEVGGAL